MLNKKILTAVIAVTLSGICAVRADTVWESGHHEILDGDVYHEIWMYNDATADMWGGDVGQLGTLDTNRFDMFAGTMGTLMVQGDSIVNIYGGTLGCLQVYYENGLVNLYAYDVVYHPTDGLNGYMDGKYINNDQYFTFITGLPDISNINVVPEPATLLLLGIGGILFRRKR